MFKTLSYYLRIYGVVLRLNAISLLTYRGNFISNLIASISWGLFSLYSIVILTHTVSEVAGWKREELLFMNGMYGVIVGIYHLLFSHNMYNFARKIHYGEIDNVLTKPIDAQFSLSLWEVSYTTAVRVVIAIVYTLSLLPQVGVVITATTIVSFIIVAISSLIFLYSLWFFVITCSIWFTKLSNLGDLLYTIQGVSRYPQEITRQLAWYIFFFFLPWTLIVTLPTRSLFARIGIYEFISYLVISIMSFVLTRKFWKFALRYYTSASS